jgi:hypothetical protein
MRRTPILHFAFLLFLLSLPSAADAADRAGIRQLFDRSGLTRQTESIPEMIRETFKEILTHAPASEEMVRSWNEAATRAYAPQRIMERLVDALTPAFTDQEQAEMMSFLDTPLGKRVVELEAGATDVDPEQFAAPLRKLQENPQANAGRLALYRDVDQATGGAQSWVVQRMNSVLIMQITLLSAAKRTDAIRVKKFRAKLEDEREKMLSDAAKSYAVAAAFAYKDLSDQELSEYIRVSNSPVWQKYTKEVIKGLDAILVECAQAMAKELVISGGDGQAL